MAADPWDNEQNPWTGAVDSTPNDSKVLRSASSRSGHWRRGLWSDDYESWKRCFYSPGEAVQCWPSSGCSDPHAWPLPGVVHYHDWGSDILTVGGYKQESLTWQCQASCVSPWSDDESGERVLYMPGDFVKCLKGVFYDNFGLWALPTLVRTKWSSGTVLQHDRKSDLVRVKLWRELDSEWDGWSSCVRRLPWSWYYVGEPVKIVSGRLEELDDCTVIWHNWATDVVSVRLEPRGDCWTGLSSRLRHGARDQRERARKGRILWNGIADKLLRRIGQRKPFFDWLRIRRLVLRISDEFSLVKALRVLHHMLGHGDGKMAIAKTDFRETIQSLLVERGFLLDCFPLECAEVLDASLVARIHSFLGSSKFDWLDFRGVMRHLDNLGMKALARVCRARRDRLLPHLLGEFGRQTKTAVRGSEALTLRCDGTFCWYRYNDWSSAVDPVSDHAYFYRRPAGAAQWAPPCPHEAKITWAAEGTWRFTSNVLQATRRVDYRGKDILLKGKAAATEDAEERRAPREEDSPPVEVSSFTTSMPFEDLMQEWSFAGQPCDDGYGDFHVYQDFVLNVEGLDGPHLRELHESPGVWEAAARTCYLEDCYQGDVQEYMVWRGDLMFSDSDE